MNKYLICKTCLAIGKYPQVLGIIDDYGILNIKRVNKLSTIIGGSEMMVTCDQCNSTIVLKILTKQPPQKNIIGTISVEEMEIKYQWS